MSAADSVSGEPMFAPVGATMRRAPDGSLILTNDLPLPPLRHSLVDLLRHWAAERPDAAFLLQRAADGWESQSYGEMWRRTALIGHWLLEAGCSVERPLMILCPNSIAHAEMALAALRVGIPVVPVSPSYVTMARDYQHLRHLAEMVTPGALFIGDKEVYGRGADFIADLVGRVIDAPPLAGIGAAGAAMVAQAEATVGLDSIAKLMFTSGSTSAPKAVINTHRMLVANQEALATIWPCLRTTPVTIVDWLPWSHTFGGNFVFNMALMHGGRLFIDEGRPAPAAIGATIRNITEQRPSFYFNVPAGFEALLPRLEADPPAAARFFSELRFIFCAAAALPQKLRDRLDALAVSAVGRRIPVLSGWGSTETAPAATSVYFESEHAGNIGLPLPGTSVKLVPDAGKLELRVRGPNVMPGYWRAPDATAKAMDEDGFYRMGDAGCLIDPDQPAKGILFDGRTAENFKLTSGTWVNVGMLRVAVIDACRPYVQDVVVAGHDRDEIGLLIFPHPDATPPLAEAISHALAAYNRNMTGSSMRVSRFLLETEPPRMDAREITDKGYLNQRAILARRGASVDRLFGDGGVKIAPAG